MGFSVCVAGRAGRRAWGWWARGGSGYWYFAGPIRAGQGVPGVDLRSTSGDSLTTDLELDAARNWNQREHARPKIRGVPAICLI